MQIQERILYPQMLVNRKRKLMFCCCVSHCQVKDESLREAAQVPVVSMVTSEMGHAMKKKKAQKVC